MPKVMLVEDDNNLREIYQARLQAEGYEIVAARDGEEGLVIAKAEKPDLVIADVMMPKISGFEMLDILRNTEGLKAVKVIMLTALGQSEDEQKAQSLGADRYLVKSQVTLEDIVKAAQELLDEQATKPAASDNSAGQPAPSTDPAPDQPTATHIPVAEPPAAEALKEDQSPAQEENSAQGGIGNFVAGASEEATPPASSDAPSSDAPASTQTNDSNADDKLVADAAQALIDSTKDDSQSPAPAAATAPASDSQPASESSNEPVTHEKVITPLNDNPKSPPDSPVNPGNIAL